MYVSSYSTYVSTNNSNRTEKERVEKSKADATSPEFKLSKTDTVESKGTKELPINYVSNYKASSNKQKLQDQVQDQSQVKYTQMNSMTSAKTAYADNSKMFSFLQEPKITQSQTPKISKRLPSDMQVAQEQNMRQTMISAYKENDKYYQITAA
jgi:hypothetical protein